MKIILSMESTIIEKITNYCKEEHPIIEEISSEFDALYNEIKSFFKNCPETEVDNGVFRKCSFNHKIFGEKYTVNIEKFRTNSVDTYGWGHDGHIPLFCSISIEGHVLNYSETVKSWDEESDGSKVWLKVTLWGLKKVSEKKTFMFTDQGDYYYRSKTYGDSSPDLFLKKISEAIYYCHKCVLSTIIEDFKISIDGLNELTEEAFKETDMFAHLSNMEGILVYLNGREPYEVPFGAQNLFRKVRSVSMLYDELNECFEWLLRKVAIAIEKRHVACNGNGAPFNFEVSNNLVDIQILF